MDNSIADSLRGIALFQGLSAGALSALEGIVRTRRLSRGQAFFSEGEPGHGFFVLTAGRVKIFKLSDDGKEQILHIFGTGEPFGEVPVFTGRHFPAHAEALEASRALYFPRKDFIDLIRSHPDAALNMMAVLSRRLHAFTDIIENLSLKEVPGRLAAFLIYRCSPEGESEMIRLDITKSQLASILGTSPETLSRMLARMTRAGLIELRGQRGIRLLDRAALKALARSGGRLE